MDDGETMDGQQLQREARAAIGERKQVDVAEALGVSPVTISRALNHETPTRYGETLARIVERYTDFSVEAETTTTTVFHASKKA